MTSERLVALASGVHVGNPPIVSPAEMVRIAAEAGYPVSFMSFFRIGWPMMWICLVVSVSYMTLMVHVGYT